MSTVLPLETALIRRRTIHSHVLVQKPGAGVPPSNRAIPNSPATPPASACTLRSCYNYLRVASSATLSPDEYATLLIASDIDALQRVRGCSTYMSDFRLVTSATSDEIEKRRAFADRLFATPIPRDEINANLALYMRRQDLAHLLFIRELYEAILPVQGVIMEFGVRWGHHLALFTNLRGLLEPYNYSRRVIGFDTFSGFASVAPEDGSSAADGDYGVSDNYIEHLSSVLEYHESQSPVAHVRKYELVVGDAVETVDRYFDSHPETIVALAYFDMDIYRPTKKCLEAIRPHITKGTVLAFDELGFPPFPGETAAFREVFDLDRFAIRRSPLCPIPSYCIVE